MTDHPSFLPRQPSPRHARGLTLVELMVALVLSLIIISAVIALYLSSQRAARVQTDLSRVQESARYAINTVTRDLRMAGFEGCLTGHIVVHNDLNTPNAYAYDFSVPVQGSSYVAGAWSPAIDPTVLAALTPPSPPGGVFTLLTNSNVITVREADASHTTAVVQPSGNAATLLVSLPNPFYAGEILLVTNCTNADVFQVTGNPQGSAVTHNTGAAQTPGNAQSALSTNYGSDGEVMPISTITYFLATYTPPGGTAGPPTLWRLDSTNVPPGASAPIPAGIASNVAQMTVYYGEDTDGDGAANEYLTSAQIQPVDPNLLHVVSLRLVLLLRTPDDDLTKTHEVLTNYPVLGAPAPATFTAADFRLYRSFTLTVALRNRTL